jgi:hypothetical protein
MWLKTYMTYMFLNLRFTIWDLRDTIYADNLFSMKIINCSLSELF